ncbi:MAG: hypothetical protein JWQ54_1947 [Mucilaginibacter sp.]|nr:hypothetical protein [Mucilaginibacter sp.]
MESVFSLKKKILKSSCLFVLLICWSALVKAQDEPLKKAISLGAELGIPNASVYSIGVGISGKAEFPVSSKVAITATAAYSAFFYKSNLFNNSKTLTSARFIPLKAGVKYYLNPGVYFEGELGTAIETNYLKQDLFAFSLGPGFIIPIKGKYGIDFGLRYEKWSNHQVQQTAIRFAHRFGW